METLAIVVYSVVATLFFCISAFCNGGIVYPTEREPVWLLLLQALLWPILFVALLVCAPFYMFRKP